MKMPGSGDRSVIRVRNSALMALFRLPSGIATILIQFILELLRLVCVVHVSSSLAFSDQNRGLGSLTCASSCCEHEGDNIVICVRRSCLGRTEKWSITLPRPGAESWATGIIVQG